MNIAPGSFFEMELPWVVEDDSGYMSRIKGTLMTPEATTSLGYRDFLQCETFEFAIDMTYPKYWNGHQEWVYTFTVSRASLDFIFAHKWFFCDLVDDWSSRYVLILIIIIAKYSQKSPQVTTGPVKLRSIHLALPVHSQRV